MESSCEPCLTAPLEQLERCQARNRDLEAHTRDLEAQLQAQRHHTAEREQWLTRQAAQHAEQMEQRMSSLQQGLAEAKEEAGRHHEHDEGEELLLFVARRQLGTWDVETQRRVLLVTKATYTELLPLVTRAALTMTRPCSFAGAIGLRELTLESHDGPLPAHVQTDFGRWSHLTGLRILKLHNLREFEFPDGITNLASLSELRSVNQVSLAGLHHLSALSQLANLHIVCLGKLDGVLPVLPSLQTLHVECYDLPAMPYMASQSNLTNLHLVSDFNCFADPMEAFEQLAVLSRIQELVLRNCLGTASLEPLAALTALTHLDLEGAGASSLQPLTALAQLRVLNLSGAFWVRDLAPLTALAQLQVLNLSGMWCRLQSLGPVFHFSALEHLDVSGCGDDDDPDPFDVAQLTALTGLKSINIDNAVLRNVERLYGMKELRVLGHPHRSL